MYLKHFQKLYFNYSPSLVYGVNLAPNEGLAMKTAHMIIASRIFKIVKRISPFKLFLLRIVGAQYLVTYDKQDESSSVCQTSFFRVCYSCFGLYFFFLIYSVALLSQLYCKYFFFKSEVSCDYCSRLKSL